MMYHCKFNKVLGTALADTGATKNYISARYTKRAKSTLFEERMLIQYAVLEDMKIPG
jgi:hypothetical protein